MARTGNSALVKPGFVAIGIVLAALAGCSSTSSSAPSTSTIPVSATTTTLGTTTSTTSATTVLPTTTTPPPTPTPTLAPAVRGCSASNLTATADPNIDGAAGMTRLVVHVTNSGSVPCLLPTAPPTLAGRTADGTIVPLPIPAGQTYAGAPQPLTTPFAVGATADVWIFGEQAAFCDPPEATQTWPALLLGLPDSTTVKFTTSFDTKCGILGITALGTT